MDFSEILPQGRSHHSTHFCWSNWSAISYRFSVTAISKTNFAKIKGKRAITHTKLSRFFVRRTTDTQPWHKLTWQEARWAKNRLFYFWSDFKKIFSLQSLRNFLSAFFNQIWAISYRFPAKRGQRGQKRRISKVAKIFIFGAISINFFSKCSS